ncbi:MAG: hypothetical protein WA949_00020 [Phormidesmis sp.]
MNNIQMEGVDSTLSQVVLEDIQYLEQHLDDILVSSDQTLIKNLIEETEFLIEQAKDDSKTYQEKYSIFSQLTHSWFTAWGHYKDIPEAIELGQSIDHITNYSMAYSHLCLSLSLINEDRIGEDEADLKRIVSGFLLLSETIDVFLDFFSLSELEKIHYSARNTISVSIRDITGYFENDLELSNLVTQLRAYSSLIILKVEERIDAIEEPKQNNHLIADTKQDAHSYKSRAETTSTTDNNKQSRPFGLCNGDFVVPEDFDMPLPEEILAAFEG